MSEQQSTLDPELQRILASPASTEEEKRERHRKLLSQVRILSEGNRNITNLLRDCDPAYAYFWAYNHVDRIQYFESLGFQLVRSQDKVASNFQKEDKTHVRGDTILMRVDRNIHEALNALRELKAIEAVEGGRQEILGWGAANGVPMRRN